MNYNLFIEPIEQPDEADANYLRNCGAVAKYWRHRRLFYALKNAILDAFGARDGYDLQHWSDMDNDEPHEYYAEHYHLLARYSFCGSVFHKPTDEFYYFNYQFQSQKHSENYFELRKTIKNEIEGKKQFKHDAESLQVAWESLKCLVRKYGYLLREAKKAA